MDYVKKTVSELLEINTRQKVVAFINELIHHAEKGVVISKDTIYKLVETYYRNKRVCVFYLGGQN